MKKEYPEIGTVKSLHRYPVKSFAGESIEASHGGWHGFEGDRRFAFVRAENTTGFPWLTSRDIPEMILYKSYFINPDSVRNSHIKVLTPGGDDLAIDSNELLSELTDRYGKKIRLMQLWSGIFDAMDVSLITTATINSLIKFCGCSLDARRFRANIVIESLDERSFPEDKWIGEQIVFGDRPDSLRIRIKRKDIRCKVVNIDPDNAEINNNIFKNIVHERKSLAGVYGTVEFPGTIKINDTIRLVRK